MKIDFDTVICDIEGQPIQIPASMAVNADGQLPMDTMSLKKVCTTALTQSLEGDDKETTADKMLERDFLARRIHAGGKQELTSEDIVMLKERIFKRWKVVPQLASGSLAILEPCSAD